MVGLVRVENTGKIGKIVIKILQGNVDLHKPCWVA